MPVMRSSDSHMRICPRSVFGSRLSAFSVNRKLIFRLRYDMELGRLDLQRVGLGHATDFTW